MNKFNIFPLCRLFKVWLIAIVCQTGRLSSQPNFPYDNNDNFPTSSPEEDMSFSDDDTIPQDDDTTLQVDGIDYSDSTSDEPLNDDFSESSSYEDDGFSDDAMPQGIDYSAPIYDESLSSSNQREQLEEEDIQNRVHSVIYPDNTQEDAYMKPDLSGIPKARTEAELNNFQIFDQSKSPSSSSLSENLLSEKGRATSYPFEDQKNLKLPESKTSTLIHEDHSNSQNLTLGKGQITVIKKNPDGKPGNQNDYSESIVGKQNIIDSAVGAIEGRNAKDSANIADIENKDFSILKDIHSKSKTSTAENELTQISSDPTIAQVTPPGTPQRPSLPNATPPPPRPPTTITPTSPGPAGPANTPANPQGSQPLKEISINFNNVSMIEYIRFISRISNKNFIFDDQELQFNVTIVSEEPTTIENLMAALLQELKIRDLSLIEQGNNIIIHRNPRVRAPARIVSDGTEPISSQDSELVTRVFRLNTLDPVKASEIIRPLLSEDALVEVLRDTNNLIITDLVATVNKITQLIKALDAPNSGVTIGQFVVRNAFVDSLVDLATKILQPIAQGNPFVLVPHPVSNSIFVVSNPFIVEKALAILQNLDLSEGKTKILSLEGLHPSYGEERPSGEGAPPGGPSFPGLKGPGFGLGELGPGGVGLFEPGGKFGPRRPGEIDQEAIPESFPIGEEAMPPGGQYPFGPGGIGTEGHPSAIFDENREFLPGGIGASTRWSRELPHGHIERTLFFIHKLRFRRGDQIEFALRKIGASLQLMGTANADLIDAINSSQWIESSNSLIFTGTAIALEKVRELILEVDVPLRQVFIEMLILDTTINDSLSYSVDWIDRFGGGTTTGEQGFLENSLINSNASVVNFVGSAETILPNGQTVPPSLAQPLPVAKGLLNAGGFVAGVIGTTLTHNGTRFSTLGALVRAIHTDTKANILLNPKIITEDNNTAEIFVGGTDRYKTQSITNDLGTLVTNNFQFIDVGTTLRVTPLIGNNDIITLEIIQETTAPSVGANTPLGSIQQDFNLIEVLTKTRTVTKIHVPNGFFVVLSGMIQNNDFRSYTRIPCLGGIPIIGAFGKSQQTLDNKRNLMLFIRPFIIDSSNDFEEVTKRQQDVYREKSKFRRGWNYEIDESLNFLNIKPTDPDEIGCTEK